MLPFVQALLIAALVATAVIALVTLDADALTAVCAVGVWLIVIVALWTRPGRTYR